MVSIRARIVMKLMAKVPYAGGDTLTPELLARSRRSVRMLTGPMPAGTHAAPAGIPSVHAEWHTGPWTQEGIRLVYFHGGGYCAGSVKTHRHFTAMLAKLSGIPVLSVDYRLAPENPFPAGLDDACVAYEWACENGPAGPSPAQQVFVGGDSAGGGMALAVTMAMRARGGRRPDGVVMLSPWLDVTCSSDSGTRLQSVDPMLKLEHSKLWAAAYSAGTPKTDPLVSPLFGDFAGLPPLYFCVGGREIARDDTLAAMAKAHDAGVETTIDNHDGMFHIWPVFYHLIPEGRVSLDRIVRWLRMHSRH